MFLKTNFSAYLFISFGLSLPTFALAVDGHVKSTQEKTKLKPVPKFIPAKGMQSLVVHKGTPVNKTAVPVQVITGADIAQTAATSLADYLERIPSIGSAGSNNAEANGSGGVSCTDIRNLGQKEVLVLLDGKRMALDAGAACVDTNTIPVQLIQSVELIKDGGEAEYGGDALAGVLNIKLRHNLNTGGVNVRGGISQYGDGQSGMLSGYKGWNFDGNRGNITLFGSYNTQAALMNSDRSWADPLSDGMGGPYVIPNSVTPTGVTTGGSNPGASVGPQNQYFDPSPYTSLTSAVHTGTLYGDTHYDFNRHMTLYSNVLYSHKDASAYLPPAGFNGVPTVPGGSDPLSPYPTIPAYDPATKTGNPYNTPQYNPAGGPVQIQRARFLNLHRRNEDASDTYTAKVGFKGEIFDKWMYDASYTYGWNQSTQEDENVVNYGAWRHLMGVTPDNTYGGGAGGRGGICASNPGGQCINPFAPTSNLTPAQLKYLTASTHTHSAYLLRDWNLRIHKHEVVRMPWVHGGFLSLAFGFEHRGEQLSQKFDPLVTSGNATNLVAENTTGGYDSNEGYLQGTIHLLENALWAKDLTIGAQGRLSNYSTVGLTKNWKAMVTWAPSEQITFRATLGQSFRQPSVYELYQGANLGDGPLIDPYGKDPSAQLPLVSIGNPNLKPELGRTWTAGAIYTPRDLPNFSLSVEYWHTRIKGLIGSIPGENVLSNCKSMFPNSDTCGGAIQRGSGGIITGINTPNVNLGGEKTSGIDWDLHYTWKPTYLDTFTLSNTLQQLLNYEVQYVPGQQWYNYTGRLLFNQGTSPGSPGGLPKIRDYATLSWKHANFKLTYMMQYTSGTRFNDGVYDVNTPSSIIADGGSYTKTKVPGIFSHDITANFKLARWNMQAGVQNLTNQRPPFVPDGGTNTSGSVYGNLFLGRSFFVQAGTNF